MPFKTNSRTKPAPRPNGRTVDEIMRRLRQLAKAKKLPQKVLDMAERWHRFATLQDLDHRVTVWRDAMLAALTELEMLANRVEADGLRIDGALGAIEAELTEHDALLKWIEEMLTGVIKKLDVVNQRAAEARKQAAVAEAIATTLERRLDQFIARQRKSKPAAPQQRPAREVATRPQAPGTAIFGWLSRIGSNSPASRKADAISRTLPEQ